MLIKKIITIFIILFLILVYTGVIITNKYNHKTLVKYIIIMFLFFVIIFNIRVDPGIYSKDYSKELNKKYKKIDNGLRKIVYKKNNNIVIKYIPNIGVIDKCRWFFSSDNKYNLYQTIIHNIDMYGNIKTIERIKKYFKDVKYFPKIFKIDYNKLIYEEEYIPYKFESGDKIKYKEQLLDLKNIIDKSDFIFTDISEDNIRISKDGIIKFIDCYIIGKSEYNLYKIIYITIFNKNINDGNIDDFINS